MQLIPILSTVLALVSYKITDKTTKFPTLFTQSLDSLQSTPLEDQTLIITSDPKYANADFEISREVYLKEKSRFKSYQRQGNFRESILFTKFVDPSLYKGNIEVIYDVSTFCYASDTDCQVLLLIGSYF